MSSGIKRDVDCTYLTNRSPYRTGIVAADTSLAGIPDIRLDIDMDSRTRSHGGVVGFSRGSHGSNAAICLFLAFTPGAGADDAEVQQLLGPEGYEDGGTFHTAHVQVWVNGADETGTAPGLGQTESDFYLAYERSVSCNTMLMVTGLPGSRARVKVNWLSSGASLDILEQHTE